MTDDRRLRQRLGAAWKIEQSDLVVTEIPAHRLGMTDIGQRAGDDDPVEARQDAADAVLVALDKCVHRRNLYRLGSTLTIDG